MHLLLWPSANYTTYAAPLLGLFNISFAYLGKLCLAMAICWSCSMQTMNLRFRPVHVLIIPEPSAPRRACSKPLIMIMHRHAQCGITWKGSNKPTITGAVSRCPLLSSNLRLACYLHVIHAYTWPRPPWIPLIPTYAGNGRRGLYDQCHYDNDIILFNEHKLNSYSSITSPFTSNTTR